MDKENTVWANVCRVDRHPEIQHVGGINEDLGGVDPHADENLMRLAGGS